jgi:hypothetical protein
MTVIGIIILILALVVINLIYSYKTLIFRIITSIITLIVSAALYLLFVAILWNSSKDPAELRLKEYNIAKIEVKQDVNWKGQYSFKALNKDGLSTGFEITIADLTNINLVYVSDSEKPEIYKALKAKVLQPDQIKITFNEEYGDMGSIILEKNNNEFQISGQPIYYINPGNDTRIIKKIK